MYNHIFHSKRSNETWPNKNKLARNSTEGDIDYRLIAKRFVLPISIIDAIARKRKSVGTDINWLPTGRLLTNSKRADRTMVRR